MLFPFQTTLAAGSWELSSSTSVPWWTLVATVALQAVALLARTEAWHLTIEAAGGRVARRVLFRASSAQVLGSLLTGWIILRGNGIHTPSIVDGSVLRAAGGTVLYFGLIGLLSLGAALVVRHTGGAITVVLGLLYTLPVVAQVATNPEWRKWLLRITPMTAGLAIQVTRNVELSPIAPWAGFGVLAGYTVAAVALGAVLLRTRDV